MLSTLLLKLLFMDFALPIDLYHTMYNETLAEASFTEKLYTVRTNFPGTYLPYHLLEL